MEKVLQSLLTIDHQYPMPDAVEILTRPENRHLLDYVAYDAFGAHIFPGNIINYELSDFLYEIEIQLQENKPIHLWINLPICEKRCFFCQYPTVISHDQQIRQRVMQKWLDANMLEAQLWLKAVPALKTIPIGEFNILGGTPTLCSEVQIENIVNFYKENFNFTEDTTIRIEGTPSTFSAEKLAFLQKLGVTKLSAGVQSFNDNILVMANCIHRGTDAVSYIKNARQYGFSSISTDFIYGMLGQTVTQAISDIETAINLKSTGIVISKLHLKTFADERTAVSGEINAHWQNPIIREKLHNQGWHWPTLGEQYQMREESVKILEKNHYQEHPTMYFYHSDAKPEKWKSLMVDQDKQHAEISFGMGGSSSCMKAEAVNAVTPELYFTLLKQDQLPIQSVRGFTDEAIQKKFVQMALSSCQVLSNHYFQQRYPRRSLFDNYWGPRFNSLERRKIVTIDNLTETIKLTPTGRTLVEAIIYTEL